MFKLKNIFGCSLKEENQFHDCEGLKAFQSG